MQIAVFTPSHNPRYLDDCYRSLRSQTLTEWRWTVVLSDAARWWEPAETDPRVAIHRAPDGFPVGVIGAARAYACELAMGDALVELDHDDVLTPTALEEVATGLDSHPEATLVFSDLAYFRDEGGDENAMDFDEEQGWRYVTEEIDGSEYRRHLSLDPSPHNLGYTWYSPNHVRAFRRDTYDRAGGYDPRASVLDDQKLMMGLYRLGDFHHIDRCLYLKRIHDENTCRIPRVNAQIQEQTVIHYRENCEGLFRAWAERKNLATATIVAGASHSTVGPDVWDAVDIDPERVALPFHEGTVGLIVCNDVLQRVRDRASFFNECYRVLVHGGAVLSRTPSTDGRGAFQDPSHVSYWNANSFQYLADARLRSSIPTLTGRFQLGHVATHFPSEWHREMHISYVVANLLAVKGGPRQGGPILCG